MLSASMERIELSGGEPAFLLTCAQEKVSETPEDHAIDQNYEIDQEMWAAYEKASKGNPELNEFLQVRFRFFKEAIRRNGMVRVRNV